LNNWLAGAYPAKRLFQVVEDPLAMLLTIHHSIQIQEIIAGALSREKWTII